MGLISLTATPTETILIDHAAHGDLDAFNQLVLQNQDMAFNHARALLSDADAAEDVTQESFIKAFQNIHQYRGGSFRGWLMRIVNNSAYDVLRQSRRQVTQPLFPENEDGEEVESTDWLADPGTSVQGTVEQKDDAQHLYQLVDELPAIYRSVITLIDLYELDYAEAAHALQIPVGTVKSRLARARLQMQMKLGGMQGVVLLSLCGIQEFV